MKRNWGAYWRYRQKLCIFVALQHVHQTGITVILFMRRVCVHGTGIRVVLFMCLVCVRVALRHAHYFEMLAHEWISENRTCLFRSRRIFFASTPLFSQIRRCFSHSATVMDRHPFWKDVFLNDCLRFNRYPWLIHGYPRFPWKAKQEVSMIMDDSTRTALRS